MQLLIVPQLVDARFGGSVTSAYASTTAIYEAVDVPGQELDVREGFGQVQEELASLDSVVDFIVQELANFRRNALLPQLGNINASGSWMIMFVIQCFKRPIRLRAGLDGEGAFLLDSMRRSLTN